MYSITVLWVIAFSLHRELDLDVAKVRSQAVNPNAVAASVSSGRREFEVNNFKVRQFTNLDGTALKGVLAVWMSFVISY